MQEISFACRAGIGSSPDAPQMQAPKRPQQHPDLQAGTHWTAHSPGASLPAHDCCVRMVPKALHNMQANSKVCICWKLINGRGKFPPPSLQDLMTSLYGKLLSWAVWAWSPSPLDQWKSIPALRKTPHSRKIRKRGELIPSAWPSSAWHGHSGCNLHWMLPIRNSPPPPLHAPCCSLRRRLSPHLVKAVAKPKGSILLLLPSHPAGTGTVGVKDSALQCVTLNHAFLSASPRLSNQICGKITTLYIVEWQKMSWLQQMALQTWHVLHETWKFSQRASPFCDKQEAEDCPQTPALL